MESLFKTSPTEATPSVLSGERPFLLPPLSGASLRGCCWARLRKLWLNRILNSHRSHLATSSTLLATRLLDCLGGPIIYIYIYIYICIPQGTSKGPPRTPKNAQDSQEIIHKLPQWCLTSTCKRMFIYYELIYIFIIYIYIYTYIQIYIYIQKSYICTYIYI